MAAKDFYIDFAPKLSNAVMILGFSGWMDGGEISTGTIQYLVDALDAEPFAELAPDPFYIYNIPGPMEVAAAFRPYTDIEDGLIAEYEPPENVFYVSQEHNLVLFEGKEPNLRWEAFAESVYSVAAECGVTSMYFIGSVAALVPHTRNIRFHGSVSDPQARARLDDHGIAPSNYSGPASFVTYLTVLAREKGVQFTSLVAEAPAYVSARNVKAVEEATRKLSEMAGMTYLDLAALKIEADEFARKLDETIAEQTELAKRVRQLEQEYDKEVTELRMEDVKDWFERQGFRF